MLKYLICFIGLSACFCNVSAQEKEPLLNHTAPAVVFQDCLDKKLAPDFYKGKILVLDFWATWCAPCIAGFPHFNSLSNKFGSKDVVFAALTDERAAIAQRFFKRTQKRLDALKLVDTSKKTGNNYSVFGIPRCVVIDANNKVAWDGPTYELTEAILDKIVNNQQPPLVNQQVLPAKPYNKPIEQRAFFSFMVAKADTVKFNAASGQSSRGYRNNMIDLWSSNKPLGTIIELLSGYAKSTRIITNNRQKLDQVIDIDYKLGSDTTPYKSYANAIVKNAPRNNFALSLLGQAFKFNAKVSSKTQKHYELVVADTAKLHSFRAMQSGHSGFDDDHLPRFEIINYTLKDITSELENTSKIIITTNINDEHGYDLSLDVSNAETLNKTLLFHGLKLVEVTDAIEFLNITFY